MEVEVIYTNRTNNLLPSAFQLISGGPAVVSQCFVYNMALLPRSCKHQQIC